MLHPNCLNTTHFGSLYHLCLAIGYIMFPVIVPTFFSLSTLHTVLVPLIFLYSSLTPVHLLYFLHPSISVLPPTPIHLLPSPISSHPIIYLLLDYCCLILMKPYFFPISFLLYFCIWHIIFTYPFSFDLYFLLCLPYCSYRKLTHLSSAAL